MGISDVEASKLVFNLGKEIFGSTRKYLMGYIKLKLRYYFVTKK
jgi:hypothetical protein